MFDAIAGRYDLLNRLLSLGQDVSWRARLKELLPAGFKFKCAGLGDRYGGCFDHRWPKIIHARPRIGVDPAANMLAIGRAKIEAACLSNKLMLQLGDAQHLPFLDGN